MKSVRVNLVLAAVLLAILGAVLHPLALLMGLAPFDTRPFVVILEAMRTAIANLLGWGLFSLVVIMLAYVIRGRLSEPQRDSAMEKWFRDVNSHPDFQPHRDRVVVVITAYNDAAATAQAVRDFKRQPAVIKVLVIDNTVITGSYKFSRSAQFNAENILFIESAPLAEAYCAYIDHLIQKYRS